MIENLSWRAIRKDGRIISFCADVYLCGLCKDEFIANLRDDYGNAGYAFGWGKDSVLCSVCDVTVKRNDSHVFLLVQAGY